jgi:hypothetical protein
MKNKHSFSALPGVSLLSSYQWTEATAVTTLGMIFLPTEGGQGLVVGRILTFNFNKDIRNVNQDIVTHIGDCPKLLEFLKPVLQTDNGRIRYFTIRVHCIGIFLINKIMTLIH